MTRRPQIALLADGKRLRRPAVPDYLVPVDNGDAP